MVVGESKRMSVSFEFEEDTTLSTTSLTILDPSDASLVINKEVIPAVGSSSEKHILRALVSSIVAGTYKVIGSVTDSNSNVYNAYNAYFVTNHDVIGLVRSITGVPSSKLSDDTIEKHVYTVVNKLLSVYSCIPSYASLTDASDKYHFDLALAYLIASRFPCFYPNMLSVGVISGIQQGPVKITYANLDRATSVQAAWVDEATSLLNMISCVKDANKDALENVGMFKLSGRRRGRMGYEWQSDDLYFISNDRSFLP